MRAISSPSTSRITTVEPGWAVPDRTASCSRSAGNDTAPRTGVTSRTTSRVVSPVLTVPSYCSRVTRFDPSFSSVSS
ncbi:hypothetical protein SZ60_15960 [Frigoribacterium sp. MEB024]|nr:hypothetical protein SZ60_15960 [Frigoribacterium sp. MEB024]